MEKNLSQLSLWNSQNIIHENSVKSGIEPILEQDITNIKEISKNGKKYRCVRKPTEKSDLGTWEYFYPIKLISGFKEWHRVINMQIRFELNQLVGFYNC
jgi:hypothetical protein